MSPQGRAVRAIKRELARAPRPGGRVPHPALLFRLRAWPDVDRPGRRSDWLKLMSTLSVRPFSYGDLVALTSEEDAAQVFLALMVRGYLEALRP